jgi:hypothetical protein
LVSLGNPAAARDRVPGWKRRWNMWSILFASLALATPEGPAAGDDPKPAPCCFSNPKFSGVCSVEPAVDESCGEILDYLNNPQSQGKSYCGNTNIRTGWASRGCEPEAPPESQASPGVRP